MRRHGGALSQWRKVSSFPAFLEPRLLAEKALTAVMQQPYVHGVSTRSVDDLKVSLAASISNCSQRRSSRYVLTRGGSHNRRMFT
jgi:putative transposase